MRIFKTAIIALSIATAFVACKKEKTDAPDQTQEVVGTYSGKYGFGSDTPDTDMKIRILAGGVFQEIGVNSGAVTGEGTWQLNGNTLTATYTMQFAPFNKYSISATIDPASHKLVGTWGYDDNPADGGKLDMFLL